MNREDLRSHLLAAPLDELTREACRLRDAGFGHTVSYSRKVFIPLTRLCRDVCHYCTFAAPPRRGVAAYLSPDEVLAVAEAGRDAGCKEALFTLGDKPELRYRAAREGLAALGFGTTVEYLVHAARLVFERTGLLPHVNPGVLTRAEIAGLREVSVSQGIMLESLSPRLAARGGPHFGSPDKRPEPRLATLHDAGELAVPFTTGILIGIGETRSERLDALFAIADLQREHGHIQEVIVQNFRAKPGTRMVDAPEPPPEDLAWTVAAARHVLGPAMSIQAPPNLSAGTYPDLIGAGLNDWGGVSPVTPDHVNPEAPWPELDALARRSAAVGKILVERLAIYPSYALEPDRWLDPALAPAVRRMIDSEGLARTESWAPGVADTPPDEHRVAAPSVRTDDLVPILDKAADGQGLEYRRDRRAVRRARRPLRCGGGSRGRNSAGRFRQRGDLCRQPQHQLHQYLLLCVSVLRVFQGTLERGITRNALRPRPRRDFTPGARGLGPGSDGGVSARRHPPRLHRRDLSIDRPCGEGGGAGHARPCVLASRDQPGRGDARPPRGRVSRKADRCRAGFPSRNGGRNPRSADSKNPLPRQGHRERVAVGHPHRAPAGTQDDRDDHVRQRRGTGILGPASQRGARPAGRNRRVHRVRSPPLRAHGSADLPAGQGEEGTDLAGREF